MALLGVDGGDMVLVGTSLGTRTVRREVPYPVLVSDTSDELAHNFANSCSILLPSAMIRMHEPRVWCLLEDVFKYRQSFKATAHDPFSG